MIHIFIALSLGILSQPPWALSEPTKAFVKLSELPHYVDKTDLLHVISRFHNNYDFVTCPPGFLKTSNLEMIKSFYQFEFDSNGHPKNYTDTETYAFFKKFKIFNHTEVFLKNRMANHPVLLIDLKFNIDEIKTFAHVDAMLNIKLRSAFQDYFSILSKLPSPTGEEFEVTKFEEEFIKKIQEGSATHFELIYGLYRLTNVLFKYFKRRVIVLVDNYDYAAEQAALHDNQLLSTDGAVHYFYTAVNNMFRKSFKQNRKMKNYALLVGISGLVDYGDDEVTENRFLGEHIFSPYFAFTEDDMDQLLLRYGCLCSEIGVARKYYGTYQTRLSNQSLYCPYSIIQYALNKEAPNHDLKLKPYWAESQNHEFIKQALKSAQFRGKLQQMVDDCTKPVNISIYPRSPPAVETFVRTINEKKATYKGLHQLDEEHLFHHLLEIGFLCHAGELATFRIPNTEVHETLKSILVEYAKANPSEGETKT